MTLKIVSFMLLLCGLFMTACTQTEDKQQAQAQAKTQIVTDALGRRVAIPTHVNRVVCIGAGALRLYAYVGDLDKLCGVEACEKRFLISIRPYQMVHAERFEKLPVIGAGGPTGSPDAEAIINAAPDVIFTTYRHDAATIDELQNATGIPVVVLSYGTTEAVDPAITQSMKLIGHVVGTQKRASSVVDFINALLEDLKRRTATIPDASKPAVYLACHSHYGAHGFTSSTANYALFNAVNVRNVLDERNFKGYQKSVDLETILDINPHIVILDAAGLAIFQEEYRRHKPILDSLKAFQQDAVFVQLPYNAYHTNLELAYANAFFIGKTVYPEAFKDIDIQQKTDEISRFMLGYDIYEKSVDALQGGYRKLNLKTLQK